MRGVSRRPPTANDRFVAVSWGFWFLVGLAVVWIFVGVTGVPDAICSKYASFFLSLFLVFLPGTVALLCNGYGGLPRETST